MSRGRVPDQEAKKYDWGGAPLIGLPPQQLHSHHVTANELNKQGYWKSVTGFQSVDFNRQFAIVMEDASVRDKLVECGLDIEGKHIIFAYHKRRANTRVYVSQLPIGISDIDLRGVFSFYGELLEIRYIIKYIHGRHIDTGDRVLIFKKLDRHIPSYVYVRGWRAFVRYNGQPSTCRICGVTGHFAKVCPLNNKKPDTEKNETRNEVPAHSA